MRKDLKFGLTIGAILVATLAIYAIVLSRGPAIPNNKLAMNTGAGDAGTPGQTGDSPGLAPKTDEQGQDQSGNTASGQDPSMTPATPAPTDSQGAATQPATAVDRNDWSAALNNGLPPTMSAAAPQRTETPMIDGPAVSLPNSGTGVNREATAPMIDSLPTTQPAAPALASAPRPEMIDAAPAAPAVVAPPAAANGQRTHRVESGETPSSIAETVYGNSKYYKRILAANPGIDPRRLKIGQILVIPELNDAERNSAAGSGATDASSSVDPSAAYKVGAGDTLQKISRKLYGSIAMADKLYQLNKGLIGDDENVLKVGWVLKLPIAPTVASAAR